MAVPIHVPRINNNDDEVKLIAINVAIAQRVSRGQIIAQVETDKSVLDIEAADDGFVLGLTATVEDTIAVGSILLWLGERADEPIPSLPTLESPQRNTGARSSVQASAKALLLLRQHGLAENLIPRMGDRLTVADVEHFLASRAPRSAPIQDRERERIPETTGQLRDLRSDERGMLSTVTWHRDVAVAGYIELEYDAAPWEAYAKAFADRYKLMLSPLLSLMAWRLVELARATPALNATIVGEQRYEYDTVNLGFTVQAGETLYLAVVREAFARDEAGFVNAMGEVQRLATAHKLGPHETQGATVGFSSMARWKVSRHIPILAPDTALMIGHAVSADGRSVLGASYDHRVLNGFQVVNALRQLSKPHSPT